MKIIKELLNIIKLHKFRKEWKHKNQTNYTYPLNIFNKNLVEVDNYTYGGLEVITFGKDSTLKIGKFCSIGGNVKFLLGGEHRYKTLSTYPFKKKFKNEDEAFSKGPIIIEDDVWIGFGCTILSGVTVGQGAIVGAGSVVSKSIPPYAIYAGNKIIKYRFEEKIINKLKNIDFSSINEKSYRKISEYLDTDITSENIDNIILNIKSLGD